MIYKSEYCALAIKQWASREGYEENIVDRFFIGDEVTIYKEGVCAFSGKITLITSKGIYLDVGSKKNKYFRLEEITEIYRSKS